MVISLLRDKMPDKIKPLLVEEASFAARVNTGATEASQLYFTDWEIL